MIAAFALAMVLHHNPAQDGDHQIRIDNVEIILDHERGCEFGSDGMVIHAVGPQNKFLTDEPVVSHFHTEGNAK